MTDATFKKITKLWKEEPFRDHISKQVKLLKLQIINEQILELQIEQKKLQESELIIYKRKEGNSVKKLKALLPFNEEQLDCVLGTYKQISKPSQKKNMFLKFLQEMV